MLQHLRPSPTAGDYPEISVAVCAARDIMTYWVMINVAIKLGETKSLSE